MLAADSSSGHNRHSRNDSSTRHKSGYEPSDTETEWHESPCCYADPHADAGARTQNTSPNRTGEYPDEKISYLRHDRAPPRATEQRRQASPYAGGKNEPRRRSNRTPRRFPSSTGDIFFSRDCRAPLEKTSAEQNNVEKSFTSNSSARAENAAAVTQGNSSNLGQTSQFVSARTGLSRTAANSSYATGRHSRTSSGTTLSSSQFSSGRFSGDGGKLCDFTGKLVGGVMRFTSNVQKAQNDSSLPCVMGKSCRKSKLPNLLGDGGKLRELVAAAAPAPVAVAAAAPAPAAGRWRASSQRRRA